MTKAKMWKDGKEFYTKGLAVLSQKKLSQTQKHDRQQESPPTAEEVASEARKETELEEACFVNRALCNLELSISHVHGLHTNQSLIACPPRKLQIHDA